MNFFIKRNSNLPLLIFPLTQKLMDYYHITSNMLDNVAITFSMTNSETGQYIIANNPADLLIEIPRPQYPDDKLYSLMYNFKLKQTRKIGNYLGEFVIDVLNCDNCCNGKIKIPTDEYINIIISDSITKTTIV